MLNSFHFLMLIFVTNNCPLAREQAICLTCDFMPRHILFSFGWLASFPLLDSISICIFMWQNFLVKDIPYTELSNNTGLKTTTKKLFLLFCFAFWVFKDSCMLVRKHCIYYAPYLQVVLCHPANLPEKMKKANVIWSFAKYMFIHPRSVLLSCVTPDCALNSKETL